MKKIALNLFAIVVAGVFFTACSTETIDEELSSLNSTSLFEGQDIQQSQLTGTWVLKVLKADIPVDLDGDGKGSEDILQETSCFNGMYFAFDAEGVVVTEQARLKYADGQMECDGVGNYAATYTVSGNALNITVQIDGQPVTLTKMIGLSSDEAGDYLHIAIEDYEIDQFFADPGNTPVSDVKRIEAIYKKK